jgi:hypothetical protein
MMAARLETISVESREFMAGIPEIMVMQIAQQYAHFRAPPCYPCGRPAPGVGLGLPPCRSTRLGNPTHRGVLTPPPPRPDDAGGDRRPATLSLTLATTKPCLAGRGGAIMRLD